MRLKCKHFSAQLVRPASKASASDFTTPLPTRDQSANCLSILKTFADEGIRPIQADRSIRGFMT